jgi:hypothetical protein
MSEAIPPLPQYALMGWFSVKAQGQLYLTLPYREMQIMVILDRGHKLSTETWAFSSPKALQRQGSAGKRVICILRGTQFESWLGASATPRRFLVFFSPSRRMTGHHLGTENDSFLPNFFA